MKFTTTNLAILAAAPLAAAHYTFNGLVHNGVKVGRDWQYIRQHTRNYMPTFKEEAATSNDFRCNQGALSGDKTDVFTVRPGDNIGLKKAYGDGGMMHPGPAQVYVSRAPGNATGAVKSYDGSGDWIKVHQSILCKKDIVAKDLQNDGWCMYGENTISFDLPQTLPDGEYLVRAEHIALHGAHEGKAEFYYACAQIRVEGSSATDLPADAERTKIPGVYQTTDAPINFSVWAGKTTYPVIPGIAVAPGGTVRGSIDGKSAAIVKVAGAAVSAPSAAAAAPSVTAAAVSTPAAPVSSAPVSSAVEAVETSSVPAVPVVTPVSVAAPVIPTYAASSFTTIATAVPAVSAPAVSVPAQNSAAATTPTSNLAATPTHVRNFGKGGRPGRRPSRPCSL